MRIHDRRRRLLVGWIQYRFLAFQMAYFLVFAATFAAVTFGPLMIDLLDSTTPPLERALAAEQFLALHQRVWPSLAVVLLLFVFHSLLVSHRFAGPLLRFRKTFEQVTAGDLTPRITLRRHDFLKTEAAALDGMIAGLRERVAALQGQAAALGREIERLERQPDVARVAQLGPLSTAHAALVEQLAGFRTGEAPDQGQAAASALEREAPVLSLP